MIHAASVYTLLSPAAMTWIIIITVGASIVCTIFVPPTQFHKSRISVFISILASITVLFIGLSLLYSAITLKKQEELNRASVTKQAIDKLWLYPNKLLIENKQARPEFLKSFYPNNLQLYAISSKNEPQTVVSILQEQNIAIVFIQAWEDYLTLRTLDKTGDIVWLTNFIQWAQSPYLKEYFDFLKYNFKDTTIKLGNILFEYAKMLPIPTTDPDLYHSTVIKMLLDPKMTALFLESEEKNKITPYE